MKNGLQLHVQWVTGHLLLPLLRGSTPSPGTVLLVPATTSYSKFAACADFKLKVGWTADVAMRELHQYVHCLHLHGPCKGAWTYVILF